MDILDYYDNISPPGSWKREMERMPWRYGQPKAKSAETALAELRKAGMLHEASLLENEINVLKVELEHLRKKLNETSGHC